METFEKTSNGGQVIRLTFTGQRIRITIDGADAGQVSCVVPLDDESRRHLYRNAPRTSPKGEPITHAVHTVLLTASEAEAVLAAHAREADRVDAEARASQLEKYAVQHAEARRTGLPVAIEDWMAPCNDPREECSLDHVVRYIRPDGTFYLDRKHTW